MIFNLSGNLILRRFVHLENANSDICSKLFGNEINWRSLHPQNAYFEIFLISSLSISKKISIALGKTLYFFQTRWLLKVRGGFKGLKQIGLSFDSL